MTSKRKPEDLTTGINVYDDQIQVDQSISELPSRALMNSHALTEVRLPLSVKIIGEYCFAKCTSLKKASIPSSVEVIGKAAFFYCTNLTHVSISQDQPQLRVVGDQAFAVCRALKDIETPMSVVKIGSKAFHACLDLLSVKIHGLNIRMIEEEVFCGCSSLEEAILPSSITSIEKMAFQGCRRLHTVRHPQGKNETQASKKGLLLSTTVSVNKSAFQGCQSLAMVVENKEKHSPVGLCVKGGRTHIDEGISELPSQGLMKSSVLKEVSLPHSVRMIGDSCFAQCTGLKKATITNSVEVIGNAAFYYCTNLTDVIFDQDQPQLRVISRKAFGVCRALKCIETPKSVAEIARQAFHACLDLESVTIHGSNLRMIQQEVFSGCSSLEEVTLPCSVTSIEKMAFQGCRKLHTIRQLQTQREQIDSLGGYLPTIVRIGERSFESCKSLKSFAVSESIRIIDKGAFKVCENLEDFEFPEGLEVIGDEAFLRCSLLGFARLPTSLVRIGYQAFAACASLQSVIMPPSETSELQSVGQLAFGRCLSLRNIWFPDGAEIQPHAMEECERLNDLLHRNSYSIGFGIMGYASLIRPLAARFDRVPLLRLCYHQSYYPSEELIGRFSDIEMTGCAIERDCLGFTALHLLALSRCSNLEVWKYLMEEHSSNIIAMDSIGHAPLGYLLLHYCELEVLEVYFAARHKSYPFDSTLDYIVQNTLPYSRLKLRSILRLSVDPWVKIFGSEQWKQALMDAIDSLCGAPTSIERVRRASHLQNKLRKYQTKEIASLLELAVWNVKIPQSPDTSRESRQNCRLQCGDEVVIRNVLPFLRSPQELESDTLVGGQPVPDFRYDGGHNVRYVEPPRQPFDFAWF